MGAQVSSRGGETWGAEDLCRSDHGYGRQQLKWEIRL